MIFDMSVGAAHIAAGVGLLVLMCAFIPTAGGPSKELKCGPIKLAIHRPAVFASGALLYGFGSIASGVLSLVVQLGA
jgi:hypothetical protein